MVAAAAARVVVVIVVVVVAAAAAAALVVVIAVTNILVCVFYKYLHLLDHKVLRYDYIFQCHT